jgi:hypothetical protein
MCNEHVLKDVWNIDLELVRTRLYGNTILHNCTPRCAAVVIFAVSCRAEMTVSSRSTMVEQLPAVTIDPSWQVNHGSWERAGGDHQPHP